MHRYARALQEARELYYGNPQKEQMTRYKLYELRWDVCWNVTNETESAKGLIIIIQWLRG